MTKNLGAHLILGALSAILTYTLYFQVLPRRRASTAPHGAPSNLLGRRVSLRDAGFTQHPLTVVLFVNSSCYFCKLSAPYYRRLSALRQVAGGRVPIIAIGVEPSDDLRTFLKHEGIGVAEARQVPVNLDGLEATPTLLVVDSGGQVRRAFVGLMSQAEQQELADFLTNQ